MGLIAAAVLDGVPHRAHDSTKFAAGALLVCGGSTGLTGAPCMAAEAAMRAGAGYVTALVPASLNIVFEQRLLEVMSVPLPDKDGRLTQPALEVALERTERADAFVLGPGLGRKPGTFKLARKLAAAVTIPLLLDADGLNAHEGRLEALAERAARHGAHPARRVSWRGCWRPIAARSRRIACVLCATRPPARTPWSCSRAMTRSSRRPTAAPRSAAEAPRLWPPRAPATCSPG